MTRPADEIDHGLALTRFLEAEWAALDTNRARWCREKGLSDSTVLRWGQGGVNIDMRQLQLLAQGLGRPLVDVLLAAHYITPEQVNGRQVAPREPVPAEQAIRVDPALSEPLREVLLSTLRAFTAVQRGAVTSAGAATPAQPSRRRRATKAG